MLRIKHDNKAAHCEGPKDLVRARDLLDLKDIEVILGLVLYDVIAAHYIS